MSENDSILVEVLIAARSWENEYHNHKENIIYLAFGLSLAATVYAIDKDTTFVAEVAIFFGLILNHAFMVYQRKLHYRAAKKIQACDDALSSILARGPTPDDVRIVPYDGEDHKGDGIIGKLFGLRENDAIAMLLKNPALAILMRSYEKSAATARSRTGPELWGAVPFIANWFAIIFLLCAIFPKMRLLFT